MWYIGKLLICYHIFTSSTTIFIHIKTLQINQLFTLLTKMWSTKIIDFLLYFFKSTSFLPFFTSSIKIWFMEKRGRLVLLNLLKNFYEKCYVKINENWWKKHTSTNNLSKKKWFYWLKVDWMKIRQNRAWISKKYASIWKKKMWVRIMYFIYYLLIRTAATTKGGEYKYNS